MGKADHRPEPGGAGRRHDNGLPDLAAAAQRGRGHVAGLCGRHGEHGYDVHGHGGEARVPGKGKKRGGVERLVQLRQPDAVGGEHMRPGHRLSGSSERAPLRARREAGRHGPETSVTEATGRVSVGLYADRIIAGDARRVGLADLDRWLRSASMRRRRLPTTRNMGTTGVAAAVMNRRYLAIKQRRACRCLASVSGTHRPADGWRTCGGFMAHSSMVLARGEDTT